MATISSPHISTYWASPTSSSRTSTDTLRPSISSRTASPSRLPALSNPSQNPSQPPSRRNRAALRDYYGLKSAAPVDASSGLQHEDADVKESELDKDGFDAQAYVKGVLEKENLSEVSKVEEELIDEIKGLDGERKALVYDNYSKLIIATDTIRKMRTNMDPLTPTTSTLPPAIAHIAETATSLAESIQKQSNREKIREPSIGNAGRQAEKKIQRATVRWVLETPKRLQESIERGERDEAARDWEEIRVLLEKWEGISGVDQVREECLKALEAG